MITKTRILSLGVALLPWLAMLASADLEVTKWGGDEVITIMIATM